MPTETPVDSSQNEGRSPKQADSLDALLLVARPIIKAFQICLNMVLVSLEVKPEVNFSTGRQDYVTTWKARASKSPKEWLFPLYMSMLCSDLLPGGFRKHIFLPLKLLVPSHCQHNSNPDNEMPETYTHSPVGYSQGKLVLEDPTFNPESCAWRFLANWYPGALPGIWNPNQTLAQFEQVRDGEGRWLLTLCGADPNILTHTSGPFLFASLFSSFSPFSS